MEVIFFRQLEDKVKLKGEQHTCGALSPLLTGVLNVLRLRRVWITLQPWSSLWCLESSPQSMASCVWQVQNPQLLCSLVFLFTAFHGAVWYPPSNRHHWQFAATGSGPAAWQGNFKGHSSSRKNQGELLWNSEAAVTKLQCRMVACLCLGIWCYAFSSLMPEIIGETLWALVWMFVFYAF